MIPRQAGRIAFVPGSGRRAGPFAWREREQWIRRFPARQLLERASCPKQRCPQSIGPTGRLGGFGQLLNSTMASSTNVMPASTARYPVIRQSKSIVIVRVQGCQFFPCCCNRTKRSACRCTSVGGPCTRTIAQPGTASARESLELWLQ